MSYGLPGPPDWLIPELPLEPVHGLPPRELGYPIMRQQNGAGLAANPSLTLPLMPLTGSLMICFFFSETSNAVTPSGAGVLHWQNCGRIVNTNIFCEVWIGHVGPTPSTSITTATGNTTGIIVMEWRGGRGIVAEMSKGTTLGPLGPMKKITERGVQLSMCGHRNATPGVPAGWTTVHQRNNDGTVSYSPLRHRRPIQYGVGGGAINPAHILVSII